MKIVLGNLSFSSVQEFTAYIERQYEQNKALTQDLHLAINYDALDSKSNKELLQFFQRPERTRNYKINLTPKPLTKEQIILNRFLIDGYLANKKKNNSENNNEGSSSIKIRKAKTIRLRLRQSVNDAKLVQNDSTLTVEMMFKTVIQAANDTEISTELLNIAMIKTKDCIKSKANDIPDFVSWLNLLLHNCRLGSKEDLVQYLNLVNNLDSVNNQIIKQWITIHQALAEQEVNKPSGLLLKVQNGLEQHGALLNFIVELFSQKPYPEIKQFVVALTKDKKKLKSDMEQFDKDPTGARAPLYNQQGQRIKSREQILSDQFSTSQVQRVISKMLSLIPGETPL